MTIFKLDTLQQWMPFRIDALGLVTILGNDRVDLVLGQLTHSSLTEWLPLLGAYTIVSNRIIEPLPGFNLYNITDGITASDLAGWCEGTAAGVRAPALTVSRQLTRLPIEYTGQIFWDKIE